MERYASTDVLIIGSGIAGLYTALHIDPKLKVTFVTKEGADNSNSWLAQGGIAAALDEQDDPALHLEDTLVAGAGLCDRDAVRVLVEEGPQDIRNLHSLDVPFDLTADGSLSMTREGGHHMNRIVHAGGDATGRETVKTLAPAAQRRDNISFWEHSFFWDLMVKNGRVCGAWVYQRDGKIHGLTARYVVLCTGGAGRIYSRSTNPAVATGDGIAACARAGVSVKNMEFIQFHPTGLYTEGSTGRAFLISEALRGEGALLRNRKGHRFMEGQHPLNELAPRDIVARAIFKEMRESGEPCVYLDITHKDAAFLQRRFPTIYSECAKHGIALEKDYIPVAPVQHYLVGGIAADLNSETNLPGLFAVGESACTGVHGANRLASNSMLECLVFGRRCAERINSCELERVSSYSLERTEDTFTGPVPRCLPGDEDPAALTQQNRIRAICDRDAGIIRTPAGLVRGLDELASIMAEIEMQPLRTKSMQEALNMAVTARCVLEGALARQESVGTHYIML